jgi:hypothetical protein
MTANRGPRGAELRELAPPSSAGRPREAEAFLRRPAYLGRKPLASAGRSPADAVDRLLVTHHLEAPCRPLAGVVGAGSGARASRVPLRASAAPPARWRGCSRPQPGTGCRVGLGCHLRRRAALGQIDADLLEDALALVDDIVRDRARPVVVRQPRAVASPAGGPVRARGGSTASDLTATSSTIASSSTSMLRPRAGWLGGLRGRGAGLGGGGSGAAGACPVHRPLWGGCSRRDGRVRLRLIVPVEHGGRHGARTGRSIVSSRMLLLAVG